MLWPLSVVLVQRKVGYPSTSWASCFIVVTKQDILVIYLTDFFDADSQRHNDVILLPAIRRVSGNDFVFQQDMHRRTAHARATVKLLHQETPNLLALNQWPKPPVSQSCGLRDLRCHAASCLHRQIHSVGENETAAQPHLCLVRS